MAKRTFIKLQTIKDTWNGSKYDMVIGDEVWIDPSVIVEVYPLKTGTIYMNDNDRKLGKRVPESKYAVIYRSTPHGLGMNGMTTDMKVDEASYEKILKELGII